MYQINWNAVNYTESEEKLIFIGQSIGKLPDTIINLYHNRVKYLDLSFNRLTSLHGIELFLNVEELILDNNDLDDNIKFPSHINHLKTLSINNNKITNLDLLLLRLTTCLPNLEYLSLLGNPCCPDQLSINKTYNPEDYQTYRYLVINTLSKLKFLDSKSISNIERKLAANQQIDMYECDFIENNKYYHLPKILWKKFYNNKSNNVCSPLPNSIRMASDHRGVYGKRKYNYSGAHSEGNRYISNNDL